MAIRQLNDGRWICYYRVAGKQKTEYFGRGVDGEAGARARNNELNLQGRRPVMVDAGPSFGEIARSYAVNKDFNENSRHLLDNRLQGTILPVFGNKPANRISYQDMDMYVSERRKTVKDSTISREITDIKAILNWSTKRRPPLIPTNPIRDYKKPTAELIVIMPPTQEEIERILQHASPHLVRAILMSYYLGLRPGAVELLTLTWRDVVWESQNIMITSARKRGPEKRLIPIHDELIFLLKEWHREDQETGLAINTIIYFQGKSIKTLKIAWKGALRRAEITRRLRMYDLRHGFVTRALEEGADIKALAEIVGSRPETLQKYYQHVTTEIHRKTIAKIPPILNPGFPRSRELRKK